MASWRKPFSNESGGKVTVTEDAGNISDGSLQYIGEKGGNDAPPTYQEASGAPVEHNSPLGYSVGPVTIVLINVTMMIGTGIYSTPASILHSTGSVGMAFIYWTLGYLICLASGAVYLEFTAYFPSRSGSEVVFLEQAYPRPSFFFPTTFAIQSVILSFGSANAIVLANYLFAISGKTGSDWQVKGVAIVGYSIAVVALCFNTKYAYWFSNAIGVVKVITLLFVVFTGFAVLGGHTAVENPKSHFENAFQGTGSLGAYGMTTALYRITFSYGGYNNAFNLVNEVKNPVKKLKIYATAALTIVYILYMLANVAWISASSKEELSSSGLTAASLFFTKVYGNTKYVRGLNFLIALSAFGNIMSVIIGLSRRIRECGRQGVLPWTTFFVSTKPFGTPLGPYFVTWALTMLMILALPTGDAFNFVNDLSTIPSALFNLAMALGLYVLRHRRKKAGLPEPQFKAWHVVVLFNILIQLFILVMPWYPPTGGIYDGDVSFFYATYALVGLAIVALCAFYYYFWVFILPKWKGYRLRPELVALDNGAQAHNIRKIPLAELEEWDATHDSAGRVRNAGIVEEEITEKGTTV